MGRAGAGFAQGFTSTLAQGLQLQEQIRARQEDLDLKKKLVSAQVEEHKAKTELATRALAAGTSLQSLLTGTEPTGEIERGMVTGEAPTRPKTISRRSLAAMIAGADPVKAAELAASPEPMTAEAMKELLAGATGQGTTVPAAEEPTVPAMPGAGTATGRAVPGLTQLPQVRVNISSKGELSASIGTERLQNPMQITELEQANGFKQKVSVIRDLKTGQTHILPLGPAVAPQVMQEAARIVDAHGGDQLGPGDRDLFIAQTSAALANPEKEVTQELLAGLGEQIKEAASRPSQARSRTLDTRKAMETITTRRKQEATEKETREEEARIRTERRGVTKKIEEETREPATTAAKKIAEKRVELEPSYALLGRLDTLLSQIGLPKTATERVTASGRLQLGHTTQDNRALVLFESLKEGLVAAFARLVEKGTMTDRDIARARALLPSVLPGVLPPTLPDTEAIALGKLKQLRGLLDEITKRTTEAAPAFTVPAKAVPAVTIPRGFKPVKP
ncbi:MAG: hypothetical protein A3E78_08215 [Alphaproteobacteria bacterium RIFCSPHIGHO2_12_FULL_63_12]|nr:MAG: hypothetical protein A3E78_08215 [Alphaproteobacteria bacterium RIFCSPHIGHO2_12_FULL_63_12]